MRGGSLFQGLPSTTPCPRLGDEKGRSAGLFSRAGMGSVPPRTSHAGESRKFAPPGQILQGAAAGAASGLRGACVARPPPRSHPPVSRSAPCSHAAPTPQQHHHHHPFRALFAFDGARSYARIVCFGRAAAARPLRVFFLRFRQTSVCFRSPPAPAAPPPPCRLFLRRACFIVTALLLRPSRSRAHIKEGGGIASTRRKEQKPADAAVSSSSFAAHDPSHLCETPRARPNGAGPTPSPDIHPHPHTHRVSFLRFFFFSSIRKKKSSQKNAKRFLPGSSKRPRKVYKLYNLPLLDTDPGARRHFPLISQCRHALFFPFLDTTAAT